jgi:hypothetical protein
MQQRDRRRRRGPRRATTRSAAATTRNWRLVSGDPADEATLADLQFAWRAVRAVKSNAILLARDGASVGIGMGQVNRVDSCHLAVSRAGEERARGAVAASDAFFPFADGPQVLLDAGVRAVVAPGGSMRDAETIDGRRGTAQAAGVSARTSAGVMSRCTSPGRGTSPTDAGVGGGMGGGVGGGRAVGVSVAVVVGWPVPTVRTGTENSPRDAAPVGPDGCWPEPSGAVEHAVRMSASATAGVRGKAPSAARTSKP